MQVQTSQHDDILVIESSGTINQQVAKEFEAAFMAVLEKACAEEFRIVLDLANVPYMSSAGLRVLVVAARKCKAEGAEILVCGLQDSLREIFGISRFDTIFAVLDNREAALQHFRDNPGTEAG